MSSVRWLRAKAAESNHHAKRRSGTSYSKEDALNTAEKCCQPDRDGRRCRDVAFAGVAVGSSDAARGASFRSCASRCPIRNASRTLRIPPRDTVVSASLGNAWGREGSVTLGSSILSMSSRRNLITEPTKKCGILFFATWLYKCLALTPQRFESCATLNRTTRGSCHIACPPRYRDGKGDARCVSFTTPHLNQR